MALSWAGGDNVRKNFFLFAVLLLALLGFGWWALGRPAAAGQITGAPRQLDPSPTAPPLPTEPPGPGYTPTPTATLWLDAPYNSYAQPIYKPEATPTPTQVPGTPTPPIVPTEPGVPSPTPRNRAYAPFWIDTASTATPTPTATATISPDATPTIHLTNTPPVAPTPPSPLPTEEPGG